ncbi:alanine dehydrogenase [Kyrpidia spormannii]|uniref:Alanine dehydrogenase n=1 Tax=Kyrpidia spormannii TaxID=2055160 RepID=A0A2K8N964_9BACL|nr:MULTISPECIES: alanine dehydrogenase [Kyrpidia]ATY85160.1 alanine dehydrogenase [Kyrpidia spormannii]MCL6575741.1 alanine dehydrogenase [Kyrpidia sp.]CAB3393738.1 L-alanine dehydrogenase (NAD-dependent) [Kyrpidia spormannii]HHY67456.1 alanine dehydrogenase [Alicyclobacillus sp.]
MVIGVPKEIKNNENRVAMTPAGVHALVDAGHRVLVEAGAGVGSGFTDREYQSVGADIVPEASEVWQQAEMIVKVKEPEPGEIQFFREGLVIFTYLHLAAAPELAKALQEKGVTAIAYETVQLPSGALPLLTPMSEVAGRMSVQIGAQFLEKPNGGKGVLLGGVPGVHPARVVIIGGGTVGTQAAKMAVGLGADVVILDKNPERLRQLDDLFGGRVTTVMSNAYAIEQEVRQADLLIGAVLIPGARAPKLVTESMVKKMSPGSVIVDVAIDQGGSIETVDRVTTHSDPTYVKYGVIHYAVANIPGAVPRTSTLALTGATLPYVAALAKEGYRAAVNRDPVLAKGVNVVHGCVTNAAVASAVGVPYTPLEEAIAL